MPLLTDPKATAHAVNALFDERQRQDEKWGIQNHDPDHWLAILTEEVGELAKAILEAAHGSPVEDIRKEAVQVAAVAVALIECLDRGEWQWRQEPYIAPD